MKPIVRCKDCMYRAVHIPAGFASSEQFLCTWIGDPSSPLPVDLDDGCTFGKKGKPRYYAKQDWAVLIGSDAAVNGEW